MHNAVIYARYSSDKQTEDSIEAQVRADRRTKPNAIRIENALPVIIDRALFDVIAIKIKPYSTYKVH